MTGMKWLRAMMAVLFTAIAPCVASAQAPDQITVLAAASLSNVLPDIERGYEAATHQKVVFSFAASMTLARQIEATAGADVFIFGRPSVDELSGHAQTRRPAVPARSA